MYYARRNFPRRNHIVTLYYRLINYDDVDGKVGKNPFELLMHKRNNNIIISVGGDERGVQRTKNACKYMYIFFSRNNTLIKNARWSRTGYTQAYYNIILAL